MSTVTEDVIIPSRYYLTAGEIRIVEVWTNCKNRANEPRDRQHAKLKTTAAYGCVSTNWRSLFYKKDEVACIDHQYGLIKRRSNKELKDKKLRAVYHSARGELIRSHLIIHTFVVPELDLHSETNIRSFFGNVRANERNIYNTNTRDVELIAHNWFAYLASIKELAQYLSGYIKMHNPNGSTTGYHVDPKTDAWWIHRMEHLTIRLEEMLEANNLDTLNRLYATAAVDDGLRRQITIEEEYLMSWKAWMEAQIKGIRHEYQLVPFPI